MPYSNLLVSKPVTNMFFQTIIIKRKRELILVYFRLFERGINLIYIMGDTFLSKNLNPERFLCSIVSYLYGND